MIINVGLPKTATATFTKALRMLGFDAYHDKRNIKKDACYSGMHSHDLLNLTNKYPDAIYFCSSRKYKNWIRSCESYYSKPKGGLVRKQLGSLTFDKDIYTQAYHDHHKLVETLNIPIIYPDDGWKPLCDIVGCDIPNLDFPSVHINGDTKSIAYLKS
jgi:hypothetical protein